MGIKQKKEVIMGVTASIAIYKACDILRRLRAEGFAVTIVMTREATELIRPIVFQSLSGNKVYSGLFDPPLDYEIEHVALADRADLVLIAPATANIIAKISTGLCDDLLTSIVCATKAPILIAPAMNDNMYLNRITQANIAQLKSLGYKMIGPAKGKLANGKIGIGHLASLEDIVREVKKQI